MSSNGDGPWPHDPPPSSTWVAADEPLQARPAPPARAMEGGRPPTGWGAPAAPPPPPALRRDTAVRDTPTRAGTPKRPPGGHSAAPAPPVPAYRSGWQVDAAGRRVKVRVVERFPGQRVRQRTGPWRRIRSATVLVLSALIVGAVLAAGLSAIVWGISVAIHHASVN